MICIFKILLYIFCNVFTLFIINYVILTLIDHSNKFNFFFNLRKTILFLLFSIVLNLMSIVSSIKMKLNCFVFDLYNIANIIQDFD